MKKYTQQEFNNFEKDDYGYIICPSGDYTEIKYFPECCIFGECCSFSERCSFGECCIFGEYCSFGECCIFGERCIFYNTSIYCLFEFNKLINLNGLFQYPIRLYINTITKEYYLSIGCHNFATLEEALKFGKENKYDISDYRILEDIINSKIKG